MPYLPMVNAMAPKGPDRSGLHDQPDQTEHDVAQAFQHGRDRLADFPGERAQCRRGWRRNDLQDIALDQRGPTVSGMIPVRNPVTLVSCALTAYSLTLAALSVAGSTWSAAPG
jgi:hypothetical protein